MAKKILVFVSERRGFLEVQNILNELTTRDCDYVFIYPDDNKYVFASNIDYEKYPNFESKSIGAVLPFKPDIVLITKEAWLPETNLITEFKQAGAVICNLENSSWLYNNIKTRLEILSRMKFPTNMIDVFFDHSQWCHETKTKAGWVHNKSVITGIPKFDTLRNVDISGIQQKYSLQKPIIVLYGSMESNIRPNILKIAREVEERYQNTHHLFYKPHPKELIDYSGDFKETLLNPIPSFKVITDESEMYAFAKLADAHIGILSSIMYYPIYFSKPVYYIDSEDSGVLVDIDLNSFKGHEYNFWAPLLNVSTWEQFVEKIGTDRVEEFTERYNSFANTFKNILKSYKNTLDLNQGYSYDSKPLLEFYDTYNDGNASKRVVDYLLNIYK